ncbi:MAG: phosphotyrosine protein phosphatase, partial [Stackebrandtia sp.]
AGFRARRIAREHVESSDLILTATHDQYDYIADTFPDALPRTFLIRHFGRIVEGLDVEGLPGCDGSAESIQARGAALVAAADSGRDDFPAESLDDPWGEGRAVFARVADEIDAALAPVVSALLEE